MKPSARRMHGANDQVGVFNKRRVLCHTIKQKLEGRDRRRKGVGASVRAIAAVQGTEFSFDFLPFLSEHRFIQFVRKSTHPERVVFLFNVTHNVAPAFG
jgi:hypothetical protein